eukprot:m.53252 g.53252  ORF g.53252 m.53252 type:complete len:323 (+) comp9147_c0_seq1:610-1578(+)
MGQAASARKEDNAESWDSRDLSEAGTDIDSTTSSPPASPNHRASSVQDSDGLYNWQRARFRLPLDEYNTILRQRRSELLLLDLTTAPPVVMDEWLLLIVEMNRVLHEIALQKDRQNRDGGIRRRDSAPVLQNKGDTENSRNVRVGRLGSWSESRRHRKLEARAQFHPGPEYKPRILAAAAKVAEQQSREGRERSQSMSAMSWAEARDLVFGMQECSFAYEPLPQPRAEPERVLTIAPPLKRDEPLGLGVMGTNLDGTDYEAPRYVSVLSPPSTEMKSPRPHRRRRSKVQKSIFSPSGGKRARLPLTSISLDGPQSGASAPPR